MYEYSFSVSIISLAAHSADFNHHHHHHHHHLHYLHLVSLDFQIPPGELAASELEELEK
jgi:hypothetical protein